MNLSFLRSLFFILVFGVCTSYSSLAVDPNNNDSNSLIKNVVLLHQEDGSFHQKEYLTPPPPAPPINVPLGSTIQIELLAAEYRWGPNDCIFITEWEFDNDFADSPTRKWDCFLNLEIQQNIDWRDSSPWSSLYTKRFIFVFQALHLGETTLHFQRRQLSNIDHFKPHGCDNLLFNIYIVDPAFSKVGQNN